MDPSVYFNAPPLPVWDWRVATDLFFGGVGVGAFLFAVLVDWRYEGKYKRICQTGAWLAPLLVAVGLLILMLKMGRPFAMYKVLLSFAPTSPIWWGGIFQGLLLLGTLIYAWQWRNPDGNVTQRRRWGWAVVPIAFIVGAYHGFVLSVFQARPLWNTGPTVVAAILAFITTGIAAVMVVHLIRMQVAGRLRHAEWVQEFLSDVREVRNMLGAALLLQAFTLFIWWISLAYGSLWAREALAAANASWGPTFWWGGVGLGVVLPLLLGGYAVLRGERIGLRQEVHMIWLTSVLILVGGYVFRLATVLGGQQPLHQVTLF